MTGHAVADRQGAVLENERTALVGVAGKTGELAGARGAQVVSSRKPVRLVTGRALHAAAPQTMGVWFVAERRHLGHVATVAERELLPGQEMRSAGLGCVDGVAGEAIHRRRVRV